MLAQHLTTGRAHFTRSLTPMLAALACAGMTLSLAACDTELPIPGAQSEPLEPQSGQSGSAAQSGQLGQLTQLDEVQSGQAPKLTMTPGTLTIATSDTPAWPWVVGEPQRCLGFDAALACAIAEEMGFDVAHINWTTSSFADAIGASSQPAWDINIQHIADTAQRESAVDFSVPYASIPKAVVTTNSSTLRFAPSISYLHTALFGVVADSTSQSIVNEVIRPDKAPLAFNTLADTKQALEQGVVDAVVEDLPTAQQIVAEVPGALLLGRLPESVATDQLAVSLPTGSALTPYVSLAIHRLQEDGTVTELVKRWIPDENFVQVLE